MAVKLSSYRVTAALDANAYAAGMAQKVAADKAGAASAAQVGSAITATQTKVSQAGDVLTRLSRSYVDGFGNAERFTRAINTLGRGIETGNVPMVQAERILDGIYRKYGLTANAADLLEQGHFQLAGAVTALNGKLAANDNALDQNSAAHVRNAAAMRMGASQRTNLLFQLQDIGVSVAGGMNPLMVATQQLPQIAMIWSGQGGLGRAFAETGKLAGEMVTKFWPVAAAVAAVATVFAAFTTEINRGQKQQVGFFDVVIAGWELLTEAIGRAIEPLVKWFSWLWDQASPIIAHLGVYLIQTFDLAFRNIGTIFGSLPALLGDLTISTAQAVIDGVEGMLNGAIKLLNDFSAGARELLQFLGIDVGKIGDVEFGTLANKWKGAMGSLPGKFAENLAAVKNTDYLGDLGTRAREVANRPSDKELKKAAEEAERQRKAYANLTLSSRQFIADQQMQAQTLGMTTEAAARLRYEQELLNKAANDNVKLTPAMAAELKGLAAEMAAAEERTRLLTEAYEFGKSTFGSFFSDLKTELLNGTSLWGAFATAGANALQSIADKALDMAANGIWDMIFGAVMGGLGGGFGTIGVGGVGIPSGGFIPGITGPRLFSSGGYTGDMPRGSVAGIVHGQEYVLNAAATRNIGRGNLDAMNAGRGLPANNNAPSASNDNGWTGDMYITVNANSEDEGAAAARGFAREMRRWQSSGEGHAFVRKVVDKPGRAN